ncbi:BcepGomrgp47 [Burkholderia phage BcepGomr]|uniref:BcepGomrgp47 n=1 Tax=Burkholderia phage BcepGomr TaxID=437329 RepID=UPI0001503500|nr:BcepGomrgp47 [Burkholderia phage BcepGomr]ABP63618.1 BcepGomrgp47 [Burkholderia phage BcepGomr]
MAEYATCILQKKKDGPNPGAALSRYIGKEYRAALKIHNGGGSFSMANGGFQEHTEAVIKMQVLFELAKHFNVEIRV